MGSRPPLFLYYSRLPPTSKHCRRSFESMHFRVTCPSSTVQHSFQIYSVCYLEYLSSDLDTFTAASLVMRSVSCHMNHIGNHGVSCQVPEGPSNSEAGAKKTKPRDRRDSYKDDGPIREPVY